MIAAAYYRVSSRAQDFPTQQAAVERCAQARGDTIGVVYSEKRSGKTLDRPELARLRTDARMGRVRRVYVFKLDRLTRSGIRDTLEVVEELRRGGAELISAVDGFALDGPAAQIILAVMAWASEMERLAINERISAARDRIEAEGGQWGRPPSLSTKQLESAKLMRTMGASLREVARALGCPKSTIARALSQKGARKCAP